MSDQDLKTEKLQTAMSSSAESQNSVGDDLPVVRSPQQIALERSARRKLDLTLIPVMTMFYLLSYLVSEAGAPWQRMLVYISAQ